MLSWVFNVDPKTKQPRLTADRCRQLIEQQGQKKVFQMLSLAIRQGVIGFPYKRFFLGEPKVKFERLKQHQALLTYDKIEPLHDTFEPCWPTTGQYLAVNTNTNEYEEINSLSDFFQEPARMNSFASRGPKPKDVFTQFRYHKTFLEPLLHPNNALGITSQSLRESLYETITKYCEPSTFKSTVALFVYKDLFQNVQRILDMSSGWGDRLLGALAYNSLEYYMGVDPNWQLFDGYRQMTRTFLPEADKHKVNMVCKPFETLKEHDFPPELFDLLFTSPPYFTYEHYGDEKQSSIQKYPNLEDWLINYMFRTLWIAWSRLKPTGHLALNISDVNSKSMNNVHYTESILLFIQDMLPGAHYAGMVAFKGSLRNDARRPIWIFEKRSESVSSGRFQTLYPTLFNVSQDVFV